jgi:hypothetical protein
LTLLLIAVDVLRAANEFHLTFPVKLLSLFLPDDSQLSQLNLHIHDLISKLFVFVVVLPVGRLEIVLSALYGLVDVL